MALIHDPTLNRARPLRAYHLFGRAAEKVDSPVDVPMASRVHAAMGWVDGQWFVRDMSSNGTWLNGEKLRKNHTEIVNEGDRLCFGDPQGDEWRMLDLAEPQSLLIDTENPDSEIVLEEYTFIPDEREPSAVAVFSPAGGNWTLQDVAEQNPGADQHLGHGNIIDCAGRSWQVFLAESESATYKIDSAEQGLSQYEFVFRMSLDEENTLLEVHTDGDTIDLGDRTHHYLLAHLARKRAADAAEGLDDASQGWIDTEQLCRDLGLELSHANIQIFRARKQFAKAVSAPLDPDALVERGKGRVRFGGKRLKVYKGESLGFSLPAEG